MKKSTHSQWALAAAVASVTASLCLGIPSWAQNAPGVDPIILSKRIAVDMLPIGGARTSSPLDSQTDMPAWLRAKVVRYEAKAKSGQFSGLLTDSDVTRTAISDGMNTTCIQEVGSNTAVNTAANGTRNGFANNPQIVVLRGDLVNICK